MSSIILARLLRVYTKQQQLNLFLLFFRLAISMQLAIVHGLKKIGLSTDKVETIPNPYHLPDWLNHYFAITADLICPIFIITGLFTRLAVIPVLIVTLSGYFVVHIHGPQSLKDIPFMYSVSFLAILILGPGKYSADYYIYKEITSEW